MGKIRVGEAGYTVEMSSSTKTGKMGKTEGVQGQQLGGCGPTPAPRGEKSRTEPNTTQSPLCRAVMGLEGGVNCVLTSTVSQQPSTV